MSLKLTFLGTGGAFTDFRENYHTNAILELTPGKYLLIDCGLTAIQSLKEIGLGVHNIFATAITHIHGDHVGGLDTLVWERYYTGPQGPSGANTPILIHHDVWPGLRAFLAPLLHEWSDLTGSIRGDGMHWLTRPYVAMDNLTFRFGDKEINFVCTTHVRSPDRNVDKPATGLLVRDIKTDKSFYYSGDCVFDPDVGTQFPDVDVIFHDCTFGPYFPQTVHTHYSQLLTLPAEVRSKMVLMHHTKVPEGVGPVADGFRAAATRHSVWEV